MRFSLRYDLIPRTDVKEYHFAMSVKLRTQAKTLYASGQCDAKDDPGYPAGNLCYVDCDGGGVSIQKSTAGESLYVYLKTPVDGILMGPPCGEGKAAKEQWVRAGTDGAQFVLDRAAAAICRPIDKATSPHG